MLRGYRRYIAAAVGCLAFASALAWGLYPEKPKLTGDSAYQENLRDYRAGGAECDPSAIARLIDRKRLLRREDTCRTAEQRDREQANSIVEARRAADAADASAVAAYEQARVSAWGAFLGVITMGAAISAALFAERAAHHTKRSADETARIGEAQVRAYLRVSSFWIKRQEEFLIFVPKFINSGQSPASKVRIRYTLTVRNLAADEAPDKVSDWDDLSESIPAGGAEFEGAPWFCPARLSPDEIAAWVGGITLAVSVRLDVSYQDVFGTEFKMVSGFLGRSPAWREGEFHQMGDAGSVGAHIEGEKSKRLSRENDEADKG